MKFTLSFILSATAVTGAVAFASFSGHASKPFVAARRTSSNVNGAFDRKVTTMSAVDPTAFAKAEIDSNDVMVFSKSSCPFCKKTKKLFVELGVDAKVIELNQIDDGEAVQAALLEISGQRTVPNVFIKGKHVGGNSEVQAANKSGQLKEMLG
eukprot:CAMPEP_0194272542 /NCGR_PEP_ID=MMETSP0169-20130528/6085_1 /TAXON_ID=218684 /ORGANISM="Corethron pennatum, Strain L29A3" /LENGTH=152 /DNA_ID=CAMNT_0039015237 /DNA_START=119 /DNA_END=580 /DNA_ORIENTATION=-